jgi:hypothetical protein
MSGSVSLAPTNDRHDADRLIRCAVLSRIEILHILLEHSYDSQCKRERGLSSPTSSATASREKPGSVQSAPIVPAAACRRRIGCAPRREGSGRPPTAAAIVARSTYGTGRKPYPRCLASGSSDRRMRLWGWPPPFRSAPRRLVTPTLSSRWGTAPAESSSQAGGTSPCCCGRGHSLSSCCPGSADLRAGAAGSSHLTQGANLLPKSSPALLVRVLVNRCGRGRLPRSAGLIPGSLPLVLADRSGARLDIGQGSLESISS